MSSRAEKEQRRRDLIAIGAALLLHLVIVAAFLISHFVFFTDVEEYRGPVLVKLGRADAPDEETDKQPVVPESTEDEQSSQEETPDEIIEEFKSGDPQDSVKVDESESESALDRPVSEEDNGDRGDSESSSEETSDESITSTEESSSEAAEELVTVTKGSEEGNAYETTYESTPGLVGRNLWLPIYWYMPVPQVIDKNIFDSIKSDLELETNPGERSVADKKAVLLDYYSLFGDEYYLNSSLNEEIRPQIWSILEDSDYDLKNADYKQGKNLRPVVLIFTVNVGEDSTSISDVIVSQKSGLPEIDDAVIYGFLKASFYNSSEIAVKGRFTYRFD